MTCPHCGGQNFAWARACDHCRHPLPPREISSSGLPPVASAPAPSAQLEEPVHPEAAERAAFARALDRTTPRALVTPALIALNVIVYLLMVATGADITGDDTSALLRWGATYGPAVTGGDWWRIFSSMFVHAGLLHLFSNMFVLVSIGPITERLYGHPAFLVLYFITGAAGSIAGIYWHPVTPSVGASGAVFGVMGMVLAYALRQRHALHSSILRSFARSIASSVVLNMVLGLALPMINVAAHVGGLVAGFLFGLLLARPLVPSPLVAQLSRSAMAATLGAVLVAGSLLSLPRYDDWLGGAHALPDGRESRPPSPCSAPSHRRRKRARRPR